MGLCNIIYALVDGVTFGHMARKASFADNEMLKTAAVQSLTTIAITSALVGTWANDMVHGSTTASFNDTDAVVTTGVSNAAIASIVAQLCLSSALCSVLTSVMIIAFISYQGAADIPEFIKNHSRKIGLPLLFLGGTIVFYFIATFMHIRYTTDEKPVQVFAMVVLIIELLVFVVFYIGMTYQALAQSDMELC